MQTGARIRSSRTGGNGLSSVARTLETIKHYDVRPEEIDETIINAINVSLCLESDGDRKVAEGFNNDLVINGRLFGRRR